MSQLINGHRNRQLKREHKARCRAANLPCHICQQPIQYDAPPNHPRSFESDHIRPVKTHPHLAYVLANLAPACCRCNRAKGAAPLPVEPWIPANW